MTGVQTCALPIFDVTFILVEADKTGAEHCQHDNPTLGQELMIDWLADKFGIDQHKI